MEITSDHLARSAAGKHSHQQSLPTARLFIVDLAKDDWKPFANLNRSGVIKLLLHHPALERCCLPRFDVPRMFLL